MAKAAKTGQKMGENGRNCGNFAIFPFFHHFFTIFQFSAHRLAGRISPCAGCRCHCGTREGSGRRHRNYLDEVPLAIGTSWPVQNALINRTSENTTA